MEGEPVTLIYLYSRRNIPRKRKNLGSYVSSWYLFCSVLCTARMRREVRERVPSLHIDPSCSQSKPFSSSSIYSLISTSFASLQIEFYVLSPSFDGPPSYLNRSDPFQLFFFSADLRNFASRLNFILIRIFHLERYRRIVTRDIDRRYVDWDAFAAQKYREYLFFYGNVENGYHLKYTVYIRASSFFNATLLITERNKNTAVNNITLNITLDIIARLTRSLWIPGIPPWFGSWR